MNLPPESPPIIDTGEIEPERETSHLRTLAELFRLPNLFTAMADIFLGFLFTHETLQPPLQFALLLVASCLLYTAGMVLNDVFDREVDAQERPGRPIPSGRISPRLAGRIGYGMLLAGVAAAWATGMLSADARSGLTATALAAAVLAYDGLFKRTPLAPLLMGACRALNVLLGMSLADGPWRPIHLAVAAGLGLYITGVTAFARTEARQSGRLRLALGTATIVVGILLLGKYPDFLTFDVAPVSVPRFAHAPGSNWPLFWILMAVMVGWRCLLAVIDPAPNRVQAAVKLCLRSLIILDAMACVGVRGPWIGGMLVLLLLPMLLLNRWLYST